MGTRRISALRVIALLPKIRPAEFFRSGNPTSENSRQREFLGWTGKIRLTEFLTPPLLFRPYGRTPPLLPLCISTGAVCCKEWSVVGLHTFIAHLVVKQQWRWLLSPDVAKRSRNNSGQAQFRDNSGQPDRPLRKSYPNRRTGPALNRLV